MPRTGTLSGNDSPADLIPQVEHLGEIVDRIVRVAAPDRIILFGSAARGEARSDSDLDLLVITAGEVHRGRLTEEIYAGLIGAGRSVDIVVVTPDDVARYRDSPALVIATALRDGVEVYAAAARSPGATAVQIAEAVLVWVEHQFEALDEPESEP